ncbi:hypothetical protein OXX69_008062 [Metschnikowia pulcherrima]
MLSVTVEMLAFLEYRETLSARTEPHSGYDGGEESEESEESDEMDEEMDGEMDGDSCDAARTSRGKNPAAVDIVF